LNQFDIATTLFVIVSKSGTTIECDKIVAAISQSYQHPNFLKKQCIAVTATGSPLDTDSYLERFTFDVGVGGRFSTTSYVGLVSLGLSYGPKIIHDFLQGARTGDEDSTRDLSQNIALIQAVVRFFQSKKHSALALVPYGEALSSLPPFMGQLICESLGKFISNDSQRLMMSPAPYLMHGVGPDAQHTFFQQLHQGVDIIPVEFIYALPRSNNQCHILKQIIGQMLALHEGNTNDSLYHSFDGHRPNSLTIIKNTSVFGLGYFISLLENRIMFEGILHNINPFDQPGVELGKKITASIDENGSIAHQIYDVVRDQLNVPSQGLFDRTGP
jgi:glucose-6-phosphate isomerase